MATFSTYTDPFVYRRATTGQETDSLVGNLARLSTDISFGATSLPVPATTVALSIDDPITIFDGPNSEIVTVTASTGIGASSIPVTATLSAHIAKTVICSDGIDGSLSEMIAQGSSWVETITQQPRWLTAYTETLQAPSMRASVDRNTAINLRPRRFPIGSITALSYQTDPTNVVPLNTSYAIINSEIQTISVPSVTVTNTNQGYQQSIPISRTVPIWIQLSYTAGYAPSALPGYITTATNYLTSALLADRYNNGGYAQTTQGKTTLVAELRGDLTGKSILIKRAEWLLRGDIERTF